MFTFAILTSDTVLTVAVSWLNALVFSLQYILASIRCFYGTHTQYHDKHTMQHKMS